MAFSISQYLCNFILVLAIFFTFAIDLNEIEVDGEKETAFLQFVKRDGTVVKRNVIETDPGRMITTREQIAAGVNGDKVGFRRNKRAAPPPPAPPLASPPATTTAAAAAGVGAAATGVGAAATGVGAAAAGVALTAPEQAAEVTTLRPDEIAADPRTAVEFGSSFPKMVTPNVTCITTDDAKHRLISVDAELGVKPNRRCPKKLPCQEYRSCKIWRTGFITKSFSIDKTTAITFYSEVFTWVHEKKLNEILQNFEECVQFYSLDQPFTGDIVVPDGDHEHKRKKVKKHKLTRRETAAEHFERMSAVILDAGALDPKTGLKDCRIRAEDYMECFDIIMLKGLCYWPHFENA